MLRHLSIRNFALIERAEIPFQKGFTAITGETGSGKSILLGALNLILGERADYSVIRDAEQKTIVEAQFDLLSSYKEWFDENDIDWDPKCLVRREISAQGKSRAFINDTPVQLTTLKELTEQLVYIHSQHQTLNIRQSQFQFDLVDAFGNNSNLADTFSHKYRQYKAILSEKENLEQNQSKNEKEADFIRFQLNELADLNLEQTDFEAFESELKRWSQLDDIRQSFDAYRNGIEEDNGPLDRLRIIRSLTDKWTSLDPVLGELNTRIQSVIAELADVSSEAGRQLELLEADPERMQMLTTQVDRFNALLRKHQLNSQSELIALEKDFTNQLFNFENSDERLLELEQQCTKLLTELHVFSKDLFDKRSKAATDLAAHLKALLTDLKLADTQLKFELTELPKIDANGGMSISFLFSANKGMELKPIEKAASGGELSRLMLAIQATMSEKKALPTLILDEIDTGVSGEVGLRVGKMLQKMGENLQLFAITHLPQVAALGQHHFEVSKSAEAGITNTQIQSLDTEERISAVARLMSGDVLTEAALENAKHLMQ